VHPDWGILSWAAALAGAAVFVVYLAVFDAIWRLNHDLANPRPRIGWGTDLDGLDAKWSFKDSWVANITVGATALIALLGSTAPIKAIVGREPTSELGLIAVAGAIAAVLVTISPLLLRVIGRDLKIPTVGGTLVAGALVLVGSLFQIGAVTIQAARLSEREWVQFGVLIGGLLVGLIVAIYAARSLASLMDEGTDVRLAVRTALRGSDRTAALL
jgi:hypothetical protein